MILFSFLLHLSDEFIQHHSFPLIPSSQRMMCPQLSSGSTPPPCHPRDCTKYQTALITRSFHSLLPLTLLDWTLTLTRLAFLCFPYCCLARNPASICQHTDGWFRTKHLPDVSFEGSWIWCSELRFVKFLTPCLITWKEVSTCAINTTFLFTSSTQLCWVC